MTVRKRVRKASGNKDKVLTLAFVEKIGEAQREKKATEKAYNALKATALKAIKAKEVVPTADDGALFKISYSEFPKAVFDHEGAAVHWKAHAEKLALALASREGKKNPKAFASSYLKRNRFDHPDDAPSSRFTVSNW